MPSFADSRIRLQQMNLNKWLITTTVAMVIMVFIGSMVFVCHRLFTAKEKATEFDGSEHVNTNYLVDRYHNGMCLHSEFGENEYDGSLMNSKFVGDKFDANELDSSKIKGR